MDGQSEPGPQSKAIAPSDGLAPCAPPTLVTPGPKQLIAFDSHIDPLGFLGGLIDQHGDVSRYQTRFGPCFLFVHPEHVQTILHRENYRRASLVKMMLGDGLLASDGSRWRSQRRLMQRDFHLPSVAPFVPVMNREIDRLAGIWSISTGETVDITEAMTRLTLRIIVQVLFSHDLPHQRASELCEAITQTINNLGMISWTVFGSPVLFAPDHNKKFAAGKKAIDVFCYDLIAARQAMSPADRPKDLLTLLVEAQTPDGPMDDRQLRDEMVTMLVGGHETTALALAWAWKLLAEHPEIERELQSEVDTVLEGKPPTMADLPRLQWSRAIFNETMRLYPPVWYMARAANEEDVIHGHPIPRGACVLISPWFTHRHKDYWPNAERFDPTRFFDAAEKPAHRYAFFPFGGGRHQCLGMPLAQIEGTIILAQLAQQFRIRPIAGQQIKPNPGITLRQSPGLLATVEPRHPGRSLGAAVMAVSGGV